MVLNFGLFALILLALILGPLCFSRLWHRFENIFFLIMAGIGAYIVCVYISYHDLLHTLKSDYLPFMMMMTVLSLIASLLVFYKEGKASPLYNTCYLALGAVVSNLIGTMAAALVMWAPFAHLNRHQKSFCHGVVFFIFVVCNVGACLTPIGDPPLLVGYLRGVPFDWMLQHTWKAWFFSVFVILCVFYCFDKKNNPKPHTYPYVIQKPPLKAWFMLIITIGITLFCSPFYRECGFVCVSAWALWVGGRIDMKTTNNIACLFLALFIALIPVQSCLVHHAQHLAHPSPFVNFWMAGLLSAFLDNTPTYMVWTQLHSPCLAHLANTKPQLLEAISLGCVWMGALSYIGNAPNLIIQAYAKKHAPTFLGYIIWSWSILIPIFLFISWFIW